MKPTNLSLKSMLLASTVLVLPAQVFAQEDDAQEDEGPIEEIQVLGQFIPDEKRSTSEISNVLDSTEFQRTGDGDVAVALTRLPGISLGNDGIPFVRGLNERYSSTLLDGSQIPSPDPLRRAVPLDLFPTAIIENVLVQKTFSPQYPGEFAGGVIDLRSKAVPDEPFFNIGISGEYNTVSTFEDGLSYDGNFGEIFGFPGSFRQLPGILAANPLLEGLSPEQLEVAGESLPLIYSADLEPNGPNVGVSLSFGDRYEFDSFDTGFILVVDYDADFTNKDGVRNEFTVTDSGVNIDGQIAPEFCQTSSDFNSVADTCGRRNTEFTVDLNAILSGGIEFDPDNSIKATSIILRKSVKEVLIETGSFRADPGTLSSFTRLDFVESQIWSNQLSGEHIIGFLGGDNEPAEINWRLSYKRADRDAPLRNETTFDFDENIAQAFELSTGPDSNLTSFGELDDETYEVGFDIVQPIFVGENAVDIKAGFTYVDRARDSQFLRFQFDAPAGVNQELLARIPEIIFGPANVGPGQFVLEEFTDPSDTFSAEFDNLQAYIQFDVEVSPTLRLAFGTRYESSDQLTSSFTRVSGEPVVVEQNINRFLPSATATWEFTENYQLRLAYSRTLARPDLRELSTANFIDTITGLQTVGNQNLVPTSIDNFDARIEHYFESGESATLGVFYKELSNPIERSFTLIGNTPLRSFVNADSATVFGIEGEIEKDLFFQEWFGWEWLGDRDFFFKANATYIDSEISIDPNNSDQLTNNIRRLQGQSDFLANFQFGFEDFENGEKAGLFFNFTGNRIFDVGLAGVPDVIEDDFYDLRFIYGREFEVGGNILEVTFTASNLLNDDFLLTVEDTQSDAEFTSLQYDIGRSFQLSFKYSF